MTTATARSARPGIGRSVPLEDGEDRLEVGAEVLDRLRRERAARLRLELARAPILLDLLARPLNRVFLRVQQVLHQLDQLDLAPLVHPVAGPVLGGVQEAELALPVPQHVRLQVGQLTHLPDREEFLNGMRGAHRQCSGLSSRSIKSETAWPGDFRLNRTSATSRAIGSSTPCRCASVTAERAVLTPSATFAGPASASSRRFPSPGSTPSWLLRDRGPVAVRMRSPIPASPAKVAGSAPSATPNRVISASPRVISAARVLWPIPSPSRMPAARAMTFLSAPASSTPSTSVAEYTRKNAVENTCCTRWATACSRAAATTAVGWRAYTSRANDGPERTAIGVSFGSTAASTHDGVVRPSGSRPLDTLTTSAPRPIWPRARVMTSRTAWDGAADTTTSAPRTAAVRSPSAVTAGASAAPGRNVWFRCTQFTLSTTSGSRAHRTTVSKSPLRASRSPSAVPHAPPPITAIFLTDVRTSRGHALSRAEPVFRPLPQACDVVPMRVNDQQRQDDARPERVGLVGGREPDPQREQHGHRQGCDRHVPGQPQGGGPNGERDHDGHRGKGQEHPCRRRHALTAAKAYVRRKHVAEHRGKPQRDREPRGPVGPGAEDRNRDGAFDHVDHADGDRVLPAEHAVHVGRPEVVRAV